MCAISIHILYLLEETLVEEESVRVSYTPQEIKILTYPSYISKELPQSSLLICKQYSAHTLYAMKPLEPM